MWVTQEPRLPTTPAVLPKVPINTTQGRDERPHPGHPTQSPPHPAKAPPPKGRPRQKKKKERHDLFAPIPALERQRSKYTNSSTVQTVKPPSNPRASSVAQTWRSILPASDGAQHMRPTRRRGGESLSLSLSFVLMLCAPSMCPSHGYSFPDMSVFPRLAQHTCKLGGLSAGRSCGPLEGGCSHCLLHVQGISCMCVLLRLAVQRPSRSFVARSVGWVTNKVGFWLCVYHV
ncbi:hypothetical protein F5883DRAFT_169245 [Diaporthe sp. PMI_573]|nr:hypothetical protein F5883DRAFT_169245 [Diaporthaceae sp. PMI_573]